MKLSVPDYILSLKPYVAGKPLEELEREYGISDAVKLASNENPLGPSPLAIKAIEQAVKELHRYPNGASYHLCERLSKRFGVEKENLILGNGSDDIIAMLARVLLQPGDEAVLPRPSFLFYEIMIRCSGAIPVEVPLKDSLTDLDGMLERIGPKTRLVFLTNPHNPTGALIAKPALDDFVRALPANVVQMMEPVEFPDHLKVEPSNKDDWATNGMDTRKSNQRNLVKTLYLNPEELNAHNLMLKAKYDKMEQDETRFENYNADGDYKALIVSYGTMSRVCRTAVDQLKEDGLEIAMLRPQFLFPFPRKAIYEAAQKESCQAVFSIEMSMGQMMEDVDRSIAGQRPVHWFGKCGGEVPTPEEVMDEIRKVVK